MSRMRRLFLGALAAALLITAVAPQPAAACPLICRYHDGHWVCGCG